MGAKLVRDRIGDIPWRDEASKAALRPVTDTEEYQRLLLMKLLEEAGELVAAQTFPERLDETADILEVLCSMLYVFDARQDSLNEIIEKMRQKHAERGGFEHGTAWEGTVKK